MQSEIPYPIREGHRGATGFPGAVTLVRIAAATRAVDASWTIVRVDDVVAVVVRLPHHFGVACATRVPRFLEAENAVDAARRVVRLGEGLTSRGCAVDASLDRDWERRMAHVALRWVVETGPTEETEVSQDPSR